MLKYVCDGCGAQMHRGELRYRVGIDVRAAYDEIEVGLLDLVRSHKKALESAVQALEEGDVADLESQIYKKITLDLCPKCQRKYIAHPLDFGGGCDSGEPAVNIDSFLRSLGYGEDRE